jgi:hypothetical protein
MERLGDRGPLCSHYTLITIFYRFFVMGLVTAKLYLSDEQLQDVENLAALNYSPEKIAVYLDVAKVQFMALYYDKLSDVRTSYDRGQLLADFLVNQKQLELAKSGNITAAQIFLKEAESNKVKNILNNVLFGHEY